MNICSNVHCHWATFGWDITKNLRGCFFMKHSVEANNWCLKAGNFDLDKDVSTWFSDILRECFQSVVSVLTHVNLQSWNTNTMCWQVLYCWRVYKKTLLSSLVVCVNKIKLSKTVVVFFWLLSHRHFLPLIVWVCFQHTNNSNPTNGQFVTD